MISYTFRQKLFQKLINRAPGECTVYRQRDDADDTETTISFTGRLIEVGAAWSGGSRLPIGQPGEGTIAKSSWAIFAPADTATIGEGDEIKHVSPTGIERWFTVTSAKQRDEGWHIMVDERQ